MIFEIDARSQIAWTREGAFFHHDFHVDTEGNLFAIERIITRIPKIARVKKVWNDHIVKMAPDGERLFDFASTDLIETNPVTL